MAAISYLADTGLDALVAVWAAERFTGELIHWDVTVRFGSQTDATRRATDRASGQLHLGDGRMVRVERQSPKVLGQRGQIHVTVERLRAAQAQHSRT